MVEQAVLKLSLKGLLVEDVSLEDMNDEAHERNARRGVKLSLIQYTSPCIVERPSDERTGYRGNFRDWIEVRVWAVSKV